MNNKRVFLVAFMGLILALTFAVLLLIFFQKYKPLLTSGTPQNQTQNIITSLSFGKLEKFKTDAEFKEYLQNSSSPDNFDGGLVFSQGIRMEKSVNAPLATSGGGGEPDRVSATNVQVLGIDEPDIVKTDGKNLYYSQPLQRIYEPVIFDERNDVKIRTAPSSKMIAPNILPDPDRIPNKMTGGVLSIRPFPPKSMAKIGLIPASGDLLLNKDTLVVFNEENYDKRAVEGYDMTDPEKPAKRWNIMYGKNASKVQARMYKNKLYLITRMNAGGDVPCPMSPFDIRGGGGLIPCTQIYHPTTTVNSDSVYIVTRINPSDGTLEDSVSFVGSSSDSPVYMSENSLYLTYHYSGDITQIMYSFVSQNADIYPSYVLDKLAKLQGYDISTQAKAMEVTSLFGKLTWGMDDDKRLTYENNVQNRMRKFMLNHARELEKTGIVKVNMDNFKVEAMGNVPGKALNQFALDEYQGNLRIATTVGQNSWFGNFGRLTQSFSDVYIMDSNLRNIGTVKDLGKTERIYSVRFLADRGYVVTFRQTDPFYVLDLSNPSNPQVKGELKIPGYSSYLHPLSENLFAGIGKEDNFVKISLFDVSSPENPQEVDKFTTTEYWSEALNNHHAFLTDKKHEIFFIPGSQGGYVFSYRGNKIEMKKAVGDMQIQRAVYINDYFYVLGQNKIVALDENTWEKAGELSL
jgi:uncharacterized secreted protein with C-terminal beta-propeller domain